MNVHVEAKSSTGQWFTNDLSVVAPAYTTLDPATAATGVDKTKPGFTMRIAQVDLVDNLGTSHATDVNTGVSVASAERILHGDLGPNTADLTLYTGPGKTYTETSAINYNAASGNIGDYLDDGTVAPGTVSPNLPGMPGTAAREGTGYDDVALRDRRFLADEG